MILILILILILIFSISCVFYGIYLIIEKIGYTLNVMHKNIKKHGGLLKFLREA